MKKGKSLIFSFLLATVGIIMMIIGAVNGEASAVFEKAVRICLECIGIG